MLVGRLPIIADSMLEEKEQEVYLVGPTLWRSSKLQKVPVPLNYVRKREKDWSVS